MQTNMRQRTSGVKAAPISNALCLQTACGTISPGRPGRQSSGAKQEPHRMTSKPHTTEIDVSRPLSLKGKQQRLFQTTQVNAYPPSQLPDSAIVCPPGDAGASIPQTGSAAHTFVRLCCQEALVRSMVGAPMISRTLMERIIATIGFARRSITNGSACHIRSSSPALSAGTTSAGRACGACGQLRSHLSSKGVAEQQGDQQQVLVCNNLQEFHKTRSVVATGASEEWEGRAWTHRPPSLDYPPSHPSKELWEVYVVAWDQRTNGIRGSPGRSSRHISFRVQCQYAA